MKRRSAYRYSSSAHSLANTARRSRRHLTISLRIPKWLGRLRTKIRGWNRLQRVGFGLVLLVLVASIVFEVILPFIDGHWQGEAYALSEADKAVITQPNDNMASVLKHDAAKGTYNFNANYSPQNYSDQIHAGGAVVQATLHDDLSQGVTITDPVSSDSFTITPQFKTLAARQTKNQIQYPMSAGDDTLIYTANALGLKEDILLHHQIGDKLNLKYKLGLGNDYVAKVLDDGSLGIYAGDDSLVNATASSAKDKALLQKARQNAAKNTLVFEIPPPTIKASGAGVGKAQANFRVKGDILTVEATNLKTATYPLSIDPTVQISTTNEFYRNTSIESNADFDATNNRITRGQISGGTTGTWTATTTMNQGRFLAGATAYNGNVYVVGGSVTGASTTNLAGTNANMVEYASIGTGSPATFGTWTAGNKSGLPAGGLSRFQLIGYHGYLYAIGGSTTDTTCATLSSTVYYASVQVNGVLGNWQTTNAPTTGRCSFGLAAYNGKIYIAGGKTGSAANTGTTDMSYALVNPDGTLTWTSGVSPALPAARYGFDLQAYNGYLYVVGGCLSAVTICTLTNTVLYNALNTDGTIYNGSSNWASTNAFTTARQNLGGTFSVIRNGYIYLSGGCKAMQATNQSCNTGADVLADTQLAQINADGSLGQWATTTSITAAKVGGNEVVWRGTIYYLAGCILTSTTNVSCAATPSAVTQYGTIQPAGQASVLKGCTASSGCFNIGAAVFGAAAAVLNGYIYVVGGCITNTCETGTSDTSNQTYYSKIGTDGTLGTWNVVAGNTINGATATTGGIAETALVAANGSLFAFGGYNVNNPVRSAFVMTPNASTGAPPASAWTTPTNGTNTNILPATAYAASAMYLEGYFIVFGGCITTTGSFGCGSTSYRQTVTRISWNGTNFGATNTALTAIPTLADYPNAAMGLAFYYGYVYLCGGAANAQGQTQECAYNQFTTSGAPTLGSWALTTGQLNTTTTPQHAIRRGAAYASNGYLYVYSGHDGTTGQITSVGTINIGKINPATGDVDSDFTISTTLFTAKWDTASAFADGNIYTVGGCIVAAPPTSCTSRTSGSEYFQIYDATNSGTRALTTSGNSIGTAVAGNSTVAYNGYLYNTGGCSTYTVATSVCTTAIGSSQFAAINPDGSIGTWASGPSLPTTVAGGLRGFGCMVALSGTLYYMGGATSGGTAQNDVYFSTATGSSWGSGSWTAVNTGSATGKLLAARSGPSCATWNDRIYVTGGSSATTTYFSPSLPTGGNITAAWTATTSVFTTGRSYHATVAAGGYLYVIGGFDGTNFMNDVQSAQIDSSGNITTGWTFTTDIPYKSRQMAAFAANGYIYIVGGATAASTCLNLNTSGIQANQWVASVNSDGSIGGWTPGVATTFTNTLGPGLGYYNGYYYIVGGNNCSSNSTSVFYAGEQSQAIRSIFTRYIDLVGDATPWKFVVNGTNALDNSIDIEDWRLTYSSSRQATNAFGAPQVLTPLQFGSNPVAITAIDGSTTNQGVGRWWLLSFDIDQTQSFTFADTTSPPAIISYSFYYAPDGGSRLRNGRIFQDQTKQSLDAHP